MYKKTIEYEDYDGNTRKEDFYFNLNKGEMIEMQNSVQGGFDKYLSRISKANDNPKLMRALKDVIMKAYGEKSDDGKRFVKSEELSIAFTQTEAYSNLLYELMTDAKKAAEFINAIMPKDLAAVKKDA